MQKKIAKAFIGDDWGSYSAVYFYGQAAQEEENGNHDKAESYRRQAQAKEAEAAKLQEEVDALVKNQKE